MATSVFFSTGSRQEKNLYEDIVIESLKIYGQNVYYLPRQVILDSISSEASVSSFNDAYLIEMYLENTGGFEGDGTLMSKFGLEIRDQANFIVARRTYEKLVAQYDLRNDARFGKPLERDLIYFPLTKSLFEIKYVDSRNPFYQLNNVTMFTLRCELFEYSNERFGTGINDIDIIQTVGSINSVVLTVKVGSGVSVNGTVPVFAVGEQIIQALGAVGEASKAIYGEVSYIYPDDDDTNVGGWKIILNGISTTDGLYHEFIEGVRIVGQSSGASWTVYSVKPLNSENPDDVMPYTQDAQNREFEIEGDQIIDFSEGNPFGDMSLDRGIKYFSTPSNVVSYVGLFLVSVEYVTTDSDTITVDKY